MSAIRGKHVKHDGGTSPAEPVGAWDNATAGTYVDRQAPVAVSGVVVALALVIMLVPLVGMAWAFTDSTTENRDLANPPQLTSADGSFNWNVLPDAGEYFEDHFAYRNQMVAANAHIRQLFGTSPTDQVVVGANDWLYYGGTLPDYLGQNALSDRALRNVAHNVSLMQNYATAHDARFAFTLAPNKNSLYSANMPYYYLRCPEPSNAERLKPLLEEANVNYVDLFKLFGDSSDVRYLMRDTHWDNRGALMGSQALLSAVGREPLALNSDAGLPRDDFTGDLESMLFPSGTRTETNWYFPGVNDLDGMAGDAWSYEEGGDVTDATIVTKSKGGSESLYMYRDSFGNALVPLWASAFEQASFSKLVPYNLPAILQSQAQVVILERAERHLDYLATTAPIMPSPSLKLQQDLPQEVSPKGENTTLSATVDGPYVKLEGVIDPRLATETCKIRVAVNNPGEQVAYYDAFWRTMGDATSPETDYGYQVNLVGDESRVEHATIGVYVITEDGIVCARSFNGITIQEG